MKCPFKNSILQHCYATGHTITTSREPTNPPHWTKAKEQERKLAERNPKTWSVFNKQ